MYYPKRLHPYNSLQKLLEIVMGTKIIIHLLVLLVFGGSIDNAPYKYGGHTYETKGMVCLKCPPGTYVKADCSKSFGKPDCTKCPNGTYNPSFTSLNKCKKCQPFCYDINEVIIKECTPTNNTICRCKEGYEVIVDDEQLDKRHCRPISKPENTESTHPTPTTDLKNETAIPKMCTLSVWKNMLCHVCEQGGKVIQISNCRLLKDADKTDGEISSASSMSRVMLLVMLLVLMGVSIMFQIT